jgi:(E)-4-hydroxy-3-methylbut-2-enyl-diphosphate synthase
MLEAPRVPVRGDGNPNTTLRGERIVEEFLAILENYVTTRYPAGPPTARVETTAQR